jgi:hypothetical protein
MATENNNAAATNKKSASVSAKDTESYRTLFLEPGEVGARKGIFVPRELVDRLKMTVPLLDVDGLTIGVYVTRILLDHLKGNADILNTLMEKGKKINMEFKRNNQLYKTFIILYIRVLLLRVRFSLIS